MPLRRKDQATLIGISSPTPGKKPLTTRSASTCCRRPPAATVRRHRPTGGARQSAHDPVAARRRLCPGRVPGAASNPAPTGRTICRSMVSRARWSFRQMTRTGDLPRFQYHVKLSRVRFPEQETAVKKRFTEEQTLDFLKQAEAGVPVKELCADTASVMPRSTPGGPRVWRYDRGGRQTVEGSLNWKTAD